MKRIKVGVVGASGYTGIELLRYLLQHPGVELVFVTSRQSAGQTIAQVFPRLRGLEGSGLAFTAPDVADMAATGAAFAFLALPHGVAAEFATGLLQAGIRVIDLSADFRLHDAAVYEEFYGHPHPAPGLLAEAVYGLPEIRPDDIRSARLVASPGCYPTSILLPLIPLLRAGAVDPSSIVVSSMSGVSGAGRKEALPLLFCECNESVRAYGVPKHRHLSEIEQELSLAAGKPVRISFVPHLVPVTAGIATTTFATLTPDVTEETVGAILREANGGQPFVRLLGPGIGADTRHVAGTNFIDIGWSVDARTGRLILMSAEDNIGKGAGGQAIQSFNLMAGFSAETGLLRV
jgi:N-acetyl-gamma-glutamyl-phosphate reductase